MFLITLFQVYPLANLITYLILVISLYSISITFTFFKFHKKISNLKENFETQFYQKPVHLSKSELLFISENFSEELMEQFIYECFGKKINSDIIKSLEKSKKGKKKFSNINESLKKGLSKLLNDSDQILTNKEIINDYSSFLED